MVEKTNPFAPQTPDIEEQLRQVNLGIYQNEQIVKSAKPGTKRFNDAAKNLEELRLRRAELEEQSKTERKGKKQAKAKVDAADAEEQYQREVALGKQPTPRYSADGKSLVPGTDAYFQGSTERPTTLRAPKQTADEEAEFLGTGTADKPLLRNNVPFTGSHKGKSYKHGIYFAIYVGSI